MRINTNVASLVAQESSANVNKNLSSSLEKLSSGLRINKAADDASGMAIADKLRTQASSLGQSISNANSANALVQIADKAMAEQSNILDIVKTKLIQAATDTTSTEGRAAINADINKLLTQFDNIASQTNYNGIDLLGTAQTIEFQTGETSSDIISLTTTKASTTAALGGGTGAAVTTIAAGDSVTVKETVADTEMVLTLADASEMVGSTLTGSFDSLAVSATTTITANDAKTAAVLDSAVGAGLLTKANDVYTFATAATNLNLGGQELSITINAIAADNDTITIGSGTGVTISNTDVNTAMTITGATGGDNLSTIKNTGTLTKTLAQDFMAVVDTALNEVNTNRSAFGSSQNQLDSFIRNAMTTQTNIKAAESVIRDVDYAAESANFNKQNIIAQAGTYAMSQANAVQQNVMRLLQ